MDIQTYIIICIIDNYMCNIEFIFIRLFFSILLFVVKKLIFSLFVPITSEYNDFPIARIELIVMNSTIIFICYKS